MYLSADFYQLRGGRACACACVSVCVSPSLTWAPPGLGFRRRCQRSPWRSAARPGPDTTGRRAWGPAHRAGDPRLTWEEAFKAAFCARADNDWSGCGVPGAVRGVPEPDPDPASPSRGLCRSDAAAPRGSPPGGGPAWGPLLFTDLAIGREPRAALPRPRLLPRAPSELGEVGACCQVTPPPPASWRDAAGKRLDGAFAPSPRRARRPPRPRAPRGALSRPGALSQIDGRRGADRAKLTSLPVASSVLASGSARVDSKPAFSCVLASLEGRARALGDAGQSMPAFLVPTRPRGAAVGHP